MNRTAPSTANRYGAHQGVTYRYSVRAVLSPMAFRSRAYLPSGAAVSGFGNTRDAAVVDMQSRVNLVIDDRLAQGWQP